MSARKHPPASPGSPPTSVRASRRALRGIVVLATFGAAAACSQSIAERSAACSATDWHAYGLNDGRLGVPRTEREDLFENCREAGQVADLAAYRAGWTEGVAEYCTAETGYRVGREGRPYHGVCVGQAEANFLQGYRRGREERPDAVVTPRIGLGIGLGLGHRHGGGVGLGLGFPYGPRYLHRWPHKGYCFYNRPYCEARGWI